MQVNDGVRVWGGGERDVRGAGRCALRGRCGGKRQNLAILLRNDNPRFPKGVRVWGGGERDVRGAGRCALRGRCGGKRQNLAILLRNDNPRFPKGVRVWGGGERDVRGRGGARCGAGAVANGGARLGWRRAGCEGGGAVRVAGQVRWQTAKSGDFAQERQSEVSEGGARLGWRRAGCEGGGAVRVAGQVRWQTAKSGDFAQERQSEGVRVWGGGERDVRGRGGARCGAGAVANGVRVWGGGERDVRGRGGARCGAGAVANGWQNLAILLRNDNPRFPKGVRVWGGGERDVRGRGGARCGAGAVANGWQNLAILLRNDNPRFPKGVRVWGGGERDVRGRGGARCGAGAVANGGARLGWRRAGCEGGGAVRVAGQVRWQTAKSGDFAQERQSEVSEGGARLGWRRAGCEGGGAVRVAGQVRWQTAKSGDFAQERQSEGVRVWGGGERDVRGRGGARCGAGAVANGGARLGWRRAGCEGGGAVRVAGQVRWQTAKSGDFAQERQSEVSEGGARLGWRRAGCEGGGAVRVAGQVRWQTAKSGDFAQERQSEGVRVWGGGERDVRGRGGARCGAGAVANGGARLGWRRAGCEGGGAVRVAGQVRWQTAKSGDFAQERQSEGVRVWGGGERDVRGRGGARCGAGAVANGWQNLAILLRNDNPRFPKGVRVWGGGERDVRGRGGARCGAGAVANGWQNLAILLRNDNPRFPKGVRVWGGGERDVRGRGGARCGAGAVANGKIWRFCSGTTIRGFRRGARLGWRRAGCEGGAVRVAGQVRWQTAKSGDFAQERQSEVSEGVRVWGGGERDVRGRGGARCGAGAVANGWQNLAILLRNDNPRFPKGVRVWGGGERDVRGRGGARCGAGAVANGKIWRFCSGTTIRGFRRGVRVWGGGERDVRGAGRCALRGRCGGKRLAKSGDFAQERQSEVSEGGARLGWRRAGCEGGGAVRVAGQVRWQTAKSGDFAQERQSEVSEGGARLGWRRAGCEGGGAVRVAGQVRWQTAKSGDFAQERQSEVSEGVRVWGGGERDVRGAGRCALRGRCGGKRLAKSGDFAQERQSEVSEGGARLGWRRAGCEGGGAVRVAGQVRWQTAKSGDFAQERQSEVSEGVRVWGGGERDVRGRGGARCGAGAVANGGARLGWRRAGCEGGGAVRVAGQVRWQTAKSGDFAQERQSEGVRVWGGGERDVRGRGGARCGAGAVANGGARLGWRRAGCEGGGAVRVAGQVRWQTAKSGDFAQERQSEGVRVWGGGERDVRGRGGARCGAGAVANGWQNLAILLRNDNPRFPKGCAFGVEASGMRGRGGARCGAGAVANGHRQNLAILLRNDNPRFPKV
ncbi:uncharacterized protein MONOS_16907 [Monocercomonoides exilis]|uniref:uncharacterized protein n=1 Tax=Monocercomonoides exilis TaxID=2049356 RepID=UPI00355AB15E|nr:hypothetical protein MONOS_16907 [Monocercomonoides exilis]